MTHFYAGCVLVAVWAGVAATFAVFLKREIEERIANFWAQVQLARADERKKQAGYLREARKKIALVDAQFQRRQR